MAGLARALCWSLIAPASLGWVLAGCTCEGSPPGAGSAGPGGGTSAAPSASQAVLAQSDCLSKTGRVGDRITSCVLAEDKTIAGVPCQGRGFVQLADDGRVERCRLGEPRVWATVPCGVGRTVSFHPSGALQSCVVPDSYEIGGVDCKWQIELHESGALRRCQLAKAAELGGRTEKPRSYVMFDAGGVLERIELPLAEPESFGSLACVHLHLWPSGKVKGCGVGPATSLDGEAIPAGSLVCFDESGKRDSRVDRRCLGSSPPPSLPRTDPAEKPLSPPTPP